jgi:large subunit ribosomal protein LX
LSDVKTFRVRGEINKRNFFIPMAFSKELRAAKKEHAVEMIYTQMGSRHRAKRSEITITSVEEIQHEEKR